MIDPVIFHLGSLKVTWFGVSLATGFFSAYLTWVFVGRQSGKNADFAADLLLWIMGSSIIGARVGYVLANMDYFSRNPKEIIMINEGGLIYYAGFIGGGLGLYVFSRIRKLSYMSVVDLVITAVPASHFFGRIGCFLNGCCHGAPHDGTFSLTYPYMSQAWYRQVQQGLISRFQRDALPVYPVQLYEGVYNLLLFALLLWVYPRFRKKPGKTVGLYLMLYPFGRFCFEFLRGDERQQVAGLNVAQALSVAMIVLGSIFFLTASEKDETDKNSAT